MRVTMVLLAALAAGCANWQNASRPDADFQADKAACHAVARDQIMTHSAGGTHYLIPFFDCMKQKGWRDAANEVALD